MDGVVRAADAVDAPEPLDDPHGVPVDVVVDHVVAVLEVLAFRNAVRRDQDVDLVRPPRHQHVPPLRTRRKAGEDRVEVGPQTRRRRASVNRARDLRRLEPELRLCRARDVGVEVVRRIGERREDQDLPVAGVERMRDFLPDQVQERLQLRVVRGRDVRHEGRQFAQPRRVRL